MDRRANVCGWYKSLNRIKLSFFVRGLRARDPICQPPCRTEICLFRTWKFSSKAGLYWLVWLKQVVILLTNGNLVEMAIKQTNKQKGKVAGFGAARRGLSSSLAFWVISWLLFAKSLLEADAKWKAWAMEREGLRVGSLGRQWHRVQIWSCWIWSTALSSMGPRTWHVVVVVIIRNL